MDHMPHSSPSEKAAADTARRDGEERESDSKRQYSKRQMRADHESKVYSVATDTVIQNLIGQYRRHKQQNAMPSTFIQFVRQHRSQQPKVPRKEPVDESIDKQQQSSIMKDGEARHRSWSEMLVTIFRLFLDLPQSQFLPLLPAVSPSVTQLIANARDPVLRDVLAQWFQRLGIIYDFMPTSVTDEGMNVEPAMNESSGCSNSNRCGS